MSPASLGTISSISTDSQSHEQDYEDDHELMDTEGCSMTSMTSYGESQCQERNGYFEVELASDSNDMPLIPTIHPSIDQLNVDVRRSARDQGAERDNGEGGGDNAADMDDSEDYLPELTVSFTDPSVRPGSTCSFTQATTGAGSAISRRRTMRPYCRSSSSSEL